MLDTKEAEAAQSAYFDPSRPQTAYVPPPAYYVSLIWNIGEFVITLNFLFQEPPPSYNSVGDKKGQ